MAPDASRLNRRRFLVVGGAVGAVGLAGAVGAVASRGGGSNTPTPTTTQPAHQHQQATAAPSSSTGAVAGRRWSDPATWPHGVPGPRDVAVISQRVVLDRDARVAGVVVEPGGELVFEPTATHTLESSGNVVVKGRLVLHPASGSVDHGIVFLGADEARFRGGGMEVLKPDVGLWVMDAGVLDLQGTAKRAWTRVTGTVAAGATRVTLKDDPAGWRPGDELIITPTLAPTSDASVTAYDSARVASIDGRSVTLDRPMRFAHPSVDVVSDAGTGRIQTAEVLNLARNVRIEGTPGHRAHIFIRSRRPQSLKAAAIRHMGPRQKAEEFTELVLGRYALHFHMCDNGSRGSLVEGVVIRDAGSHAFVPHLSNGIVFRDCISHDTVDDAYWWDQAPDTRTEAPPSHDIRYERCVASLVTYDPPFRGYRLAGFNLGRGNGNTIGDCAAVGIQGTVDASGFIWPEGSEGIWGFRDCVAHNNAAHGIFAWQNTPKPHLITRFTAYHNLGAGISNGAYNNSYTYRDSTLYGNREGAVVIHANSWAGSRPVQFVNLACHGAGLSDYLVVAPRHNGEVETVPIRFAGCSFRDARKAAFGWTYQGSDGPSTDEVVDIVDCSFAGNEFWLASRVGANSRIRVKDNAHGSIVLRRADRSGTFQAKWNARVERNPGFRG
jgi:G8 domain